jgi:hypothetical protein
LVPFPGFAKRKELDLWRGMFVVPRVSVYMLLLGPSTALYTPDLCSSAVYALLPDTSLFVFYTQDRSVNAPFSAVRSWHFPVPETPDPSCVLYTSAQYMLFDMRVYALFALHLLKRGDALSFWLEGDEAPYPSIISVSYTPHPKHVLRCRY